MIGTTASLALAIVSGVVLLGMAIAYRRPARVPVATTLGQRKARY